MRCRARLVASLSIVLQSFVCCTNLSGSSGGPVLSCFLFEPMLLTELSRLVGFEVIVPVGTVRLVAMLYKTSLPRLESVLIVAVVVVWASSEPFELASSGSEKCLPFFRALFLRAIVI